jgi:hypothetical protein
MVLHTENLKKTYSNIEEVKFTHIVAYQINTQASALISDREMPWV